MISRNYKYIIAICFLFGVIVSGSYSSDKSNLEISSDVRLRYEKDYDVTGKEVRDRARFRLRVSLESKQDRFTIGARLVSGSQSDQQSPHQTFGDDFSTKTVSIDKVFVRYTHESYWVWAGKNSFPFWKQNELLWDDDVTPEGVSAGLNYADDNYALGLIGGYYIIDDFGSFEEPSIMAVQGNFLASFDNVKATLAGGFYYFNNFDGDTISYNPLSNIDYGIVVISGQLKFSTQSFPITIGGDFMTNTENPTETGFEEETNGWAVQGALGELREEGDFLIGAYYANIEKYAVVGNFAQDDWWRFGSGHTNSSNFKGFEVRLGYQITNQINIIARHYKTEEILGANEAKRFRIDLNANL